MAEEGIVAKIDAAIGDFLGSWNSFTTILAFIVLVVFLYPLFAGQEPDIHPFLLARQAQASPVRQQGESAVYRSNDLPYGYPLRTGLAVKDPGAPKWSSGRDGDLRDVWRATVRGPVREDGTSAGRKGKITTVLGAEQTQSHDLDALTTDINVIGKYIRDAGGKRVAVSLSNSVELLCTVFAGSFYGFTPVLVPYGQEPTEALPLIEKSGADTLIAEAGTVALDNLLSKSSGIRRIVWVAKAGSKHLDWNEVPEGIGGKLDVSTWHDLVEEKKSSDSKDVLAFEKDSTAPSVFAFWPQKDGNHELLEYTSENLVSAIAALIASLPRNRKLTNLDTLISTAPLTQTYPLCWTLAALYSNANLVLNSVAGESVNLAAATRQAKPTFIVATSETVNKYHETVLPTIGAGIAGKIAKYFAQRTMAAGAMPLDKPASLSATPQLDQLRTLLISQRDTAPANTRITSNILVNLRLALGARIGYALTTGRVAGAVCQSNILDYRNKGNKVVVGGPVSSVEVNIVGSEEDLSRETAVGGNAKGKIVVKGPAVVGEKKVELDLTGEVDADHTMILV